jgi:hypothetical protein
VPGTVPAGSVHTASGLAALQVNAPGLLTLAKSRPVPRVSVKVSTSRVLPSATVTSTV